VHAAVSTNMAAALIVFFMLFAPRSKI